MSQPKVRLVEMDDWYGLYINGELVDEGHHMHGERLIDILNRELELVGGLDISARWDDHLACAGAGRAPQKYQDSYGQEDGFCIYEEGKH